MDSVQGLDYLKPVDAEDVGLNPDYVYRSFPSGDKYLKNLLEDFNISGNDSILDIGCGKGSAMRTMLKFPFARVDGIELSEDIALIAMKNIEILHIDRSNIFICNASQFKDYDNYNYFYIYNPFPSFVMSTVVGNLVQSIQRVQRKVVLIYNNPTCHDVIVSKGKFCKTREYPDEWKKGIFIYSNVDTEPKCQDSFETVDCL
jgi:SAM-dependent methyltransferase